MQLETACHHPYPLPPTRARAMFCGAREGRLCPAHASAVARSRVLVSLWREGRGRSRVKDGGVAQRGAKSETIPPRRRRRCGSGRHWSSTSLSAAGETPRSSDHFQTTKRSTDQSQHRCCVGETQRGAPVAAGGPDDLAGPVCSAAHAWAPQPAGGGAPATRTVATAGGRRGVGQASLYGVRRPLCSAPRPPPPPSGRRDGRPFGHPPARSPKRPFDGSR